MGGSAAVQRSSLDSLVIGGESAREWVSWEGKEKPGTIVIDTSKRTLSLVQGVWAGDPV